MTFKATEKWLVFLIPSLFDAPARGNLLEFLEIFWMTLTLQKLDGWGYEMMKISSS